MGATNENDNNSHFFREIAPYFLGLVERPLGVSRRRSQSQRLGKSPTRSQQSLPKILKSVPIQNRWKIAPAIALLAMSEE
jgi:hypothetical protein